jgi:hypothetical protein
MKSWETAGVRGEKVEEIPLRHQRDVGALDRQVGEIGDGHLGVADERADLFHHLVRLLKELVEQAEFVHQLQRGGMDGVAAKVAQEIAVLFEHIDLDPGAGEEKAEHHAGRAASHDTDVHGGRGVGIRRGELLLLFMNRAAAQIRIVLEHLEALLLELLVLRGEVAGRGFAFLGGFGAFQNNLFAHGCRGLGRIE